LRSQRIAVALTAMLPLAGLVGGAAACAALDGRGPDATSQSSASAPATLSSAPSAASTAVTPTPSAAAAPAKLPPPVLAAAGLGKAPQATALASKIAAVRVKNVKGTYSGSVIDVGTGNVLFNHGARTPHIPASTMKVMTSAAALSILGPDHRFATSVVGPREGQIVLVGGGDPYLATKTKPTAYPRPASTDELARLTAEALREAKITKVRLGYDASLFGGPGWNPLWPDGYGDSVTTVSALWVDEGRVAASIGPRAKDPAKGAATAFAKALKKRGVSVSSVAPAKAGKGAAKLATVRSLPLDQIVEQLLMTSDNDAAEVILRQAAIGAGRKGTSADGVAVVRAELTKLGVWDPGTTMTDGSGLARQSRVPADTLARLLRLAAGNDHPELRAVITGLPVAGVEGSLRIRFFDDQSLAGRGVVRAKTGTLRKVHSLAGMVRTVDGSLVTFAFLINNPKNDYAANVWLDRVSTAISRCGCR
jgi:serine-type D-Ala-D-Ala carboxypeptidase/endopeptidase (penicillin-binding protein 4)